MIPNNGWCFVDFYADWCSPCKALAPVFEAVRSSKIYSDVKFLKFDVSGNEEYVSEKKVRALPTLVLFKDGEEVGRLVGLQSEESIKGFLNTNLEK
jgi:thioredoxin 1